MTVEPIRRVLRALLPRQERPPRTLVVQHLGFDGEVLDTLPDVLDEVGRDLGMELRLDGVGGDLVIADRSFVSRVAPQVLHAFLEDRPLVTVSPALDDAQPARVRASELHGELVRELRNLGPRSALAADPVSATEASTLPPPSDFDSNFDSRQQGHELAGVELDPDRAELLNRLRRGYVDPLQPPLVAGYGRHAAMHIDFAVGVVRIDELADQRLRISRDVPYLARHAEVGPGAKVRDIELVVWDIALAAGDFRLLNSPINWWHTKLVAQPGIDVARFTLQPRLLQLARCLAQEPLSPSELRVRGRLSLRELRGFLQAGLFLGMLRWVSSPTGCDD